MADNQFIFQKNDSTHLIKYCGNDEFVAIPEGVTTIGKAAFASCFSLREVVFPTTLKEIKALAFFNCINLETTSPLTYEIADDAFLGCPKMKKENFTLKEMTIEQIESQPLTDFYIRDYQRGYRWTKNEIEELLNDIKELIKNDIGTVSRYCLQPLILKTCKPEKIQRYISSKADTLECKEMTLDYAYELIDGQQRLTTILLILNECHKRSKISYPVNYRIYYELLREIDNYYIDNAKDTIRNWLDNQPNEFDINTFISTIRENLFFIWYEMKTDNSIVVEEEFRNINDGQTPLTNAELFKALLLNPENATVYDDGHKEDIKAKLYEMAFQWDELEQNLHNNDFWFFISNYECRERTHLDYLFELFAVSLDSLSTNRRRKGKADFDDFKSRLNALDKNRDRYSFLAVKAYVEYLDYAENDGKRFESVKQVWEKIVKQYHHLYSWYANSELYHTIGYLIATEGTKNGNSIVPDIVIELFRGFEDKDLNEIIAFVRKKIADHLKSQIVENEKKNNITIFSANYYERNKKDIRDFLLYVNVCSTFIANEKFPFDRFKNTKDPSSGKTIKWDIEHVSARNLKEKISDEELEKIKPWWQKEDKNTSNADKSERKWNREEWKRFAERVNENEPDNSISNLVLLDSNTNRSYGDALFFGKRKEIIERDKKNAYIPICTKNVFLKYYTKTPDFSEAWTEADKDGYFANILICVRDGFGHDGILNSIDAPQSVKDKIADIIEEYTAEEEAK